MNTISAVARSCLAGLAVLCSGAGLAATATVTASDSRPQVGDTFFVTVGGAGFPGTSGATLQLSWDSDVVSVTGVELASGSPFTDLLADPPYALITLLSPLTGTLPSGDFEAFRINFTAVAEGDARIQVVDDGVDFAWTDVNGQPLAVDYTQADIRVTPLPGTFWLLGSAFGLLGLRGGKRRVRMPVLRPCSV
jgi:hypothetical protein